VALVASTDTEKVMDYVEGLFFAIGRAQNQVAFSIFAA
jgi:hypothetical protein